MSYEFGVRSYEFGVVAATRELLHKCSPGSRIAISVLNMLMKRKNNS